MQPCACTFARNEKKYMLTRRQADALLGSMAAYIRPDEYGDYTICSLYYDTPCFRSFVQAQARVDYREKLRLRSYGVPTADGQVFLELKKKVRGTSYKRRLPICHGEARAYLERGVPPAGGGQIFGEVDWYLRRYAPEPKVVLCYDRLAFAGRMDEGVRLTFDTNIRWRGAELRLDRGDWGAPLLARDRVLLEVKTPGPQPLWLARCLSGAGAFPTGFSKYSHAAALLLEREAQRDAG